MSGLTIIDLALKTDQLLSRVDALLLGRVLVATQEYRPETAKADPGVGRFRLNHATLANVTEIYLDDQDTSGSSIAALIDTYDDSTSTVKGTLILKSLDSTDHWAAYRIIGSVVNETGYRSITVEHIVSNGTWVAGEQFSQDFRRSGDVGQANTLSIGTVALGEEFSAEITGAVPNQILNITVPPGPKGDIGLSPNIEIGNVYEGPAAVTLLGESPNYVLNITVPKGNTGNTGPRGFSVLYGAGPPDNSTGSNSEFYIDTDNNYIYGPKAFGVWPAGTAIKGDKGDKGDAGVNANTILSGAGNPGSGIGVNGDYFIDTTGLRFYGPKSVAGWGDPTDIRGPVGPGSGDVIGPTGAVANHIAVYDGATGKILKGGGVSVTEIQTNINAAVASANTRTGVSVIRTEAFTFVPMDPRQEIDVSAGPFTGTLPAFPAIGSWVEVGDAFNLFDVNTFTVGRADNLIGGLAEDMECTTAGIKFRLTFVGGLIGWRVSL